nr:RIPOR family member 3 isoform X2 [Paramormyrops kingsleyae]XP_023651176.1 RIPOR family member 3 isoform X2 [Paramormyrops kingsleyae]
MSVKLRFEYPAEGGVQRSRSFTGFSTLNSRRRLSSSIWGPQSSQVDRVFQALRKGLKEYLQAHQAEMDFLTSQQRDSKRNSRLAFLYDLEKEIRILERYIRRLEFHISKVEELYETYSIQWRLCQGAMNMKKAFSLSPTTRASRGSLLELNRSHRLSLEDMYIMVGELEILLGELRIKMKGLIGFARLCPGDQYEVIIRLGRQRWRIRGKIQADDQQSWDEEEMVFLPHIYENFEIKVTEVKGLVSVPVGVVTCESADFFTAQPQMMVVDITELGTIKLQLEVLWNPFDSREARPVTPSPSKPSIHSRKGSIYSWTPPSTPSFTEKYFITMVKQFQDSENAFSVSSQESRGISLLSYLSDTSQVFMPSIFGGSEMQINSVRSSDARDHMGMKLSAGGSTDWLPDSDHCPATPRRLTPSLPRYGTPDILKQNEGSAPVRHTEHMEAVSKDVSVMEPLSFKNPEGPPLTIPVVTSAQSRALALAISSHLGQLEAELQQKHICEPETEKLEKQVQRFKIILKNDNYMPKPSPTETLSVEEVLGSFDFLSMDFNADEVSSLGSVRLRNPEISSFKGNNLTILGLTPQDVQSQKKAESIPLTTGHCGLDQTLEIHLGMCNMLLQHIKRTDSPIVQKELLDELSQQLKVLEKVGKLSLEKNLDLTSIKDIVPKAQRQKSLLAFWEECTLGGSPFCCSAKVALQTLRKRYIHKVKAKQPGQTDAVFLQLLQQMQSICRMVPVPPHSSDHVTIFQFFNHLTRWGLTDFGEHVSRLSKEMQLVSAFQSPERRRALRRLKGKRISELQPLHSTLRLLATMHTDDNRKVSQAASSRLCRASAFKAFRAKAVVYYTTMLGHTDAQLQRAACLALKSLSATESVEQVADLWQSADEELRNAARETVLSFGKTGHAVGGRVNITSHVPRMPELAPNQHEFYISKFVQIAQYGHVCFCYLPWTAGVCTVDSDVVIHQ